MNRFKLMFLFFNLCMVSNSYILASSDMKTVFIENEEINQKRKNSFDEPDGKKLKIDYMTLVDLPINPVEDYKVFKQIFPLFNGTCKLKVKFSNHLKSLEAEIDNGVFSFGINSSYSEADEKEAMLAFFNLQISFTKDELAGFLRIKNLYKKIVRYPGYFDVLKKFYPEELNKMSVLPGLIKTRSRELIEIRKKTDTIFRFKEEYYLFYLFGCINHEGLCKMPINHKLASENFTFVSDLFNPYFSHFEDKNIIMLGYNERVKNELKESNDSYGNYILGNLYLHEKNYQESYKYFRLSALAGNIEALAYLAEFYKYGDVGIEDFEMAVNLSKLAANFGSEKAKANMMEWLPTH